MKSFTPPTVAVTLVAAIGPLGVFSAATATTMAGAYTAAAITVLTLTGAVTHAILWARHQRIPAPVLV
jgi:hypothetical protein